jgi:hypothetical protein
MYLEKNVSSIAFSQVYCKFESFYKEIFYPHSLSYHFGFFGNFACAHVTRVPTGLQEAFLFLGRVFFSLLLSGSSISGRNSGEIPS